MCLQNTRLHSFRCQNHIHRSQSSLATIEKPDKSPLHVYVYVPTDLTCLMRWQASITHIRKIILIVYMMFVCSQVNRVAGHSIVYFTRSILTPLSTRIPHPLCPYPHSSLSTHPLLQVHHHPSAGEILGGPTLDFISGAKCFFFVQVHILPST